MTKVQPEISDPAVCDFDTYKFMSKAANNYIVKIRQGMAHSIGVI